MTVEHVYLRMNIGRYDLLHPQDTQVLVHLSAQIDGVRQVIEDCWTRDDEDELRALVHDHDVSGVLDQFEARRKRYLTSRPCQVPVFRPHEQALTLALLTQRLGVLRDEQEHLERRVRALQG